MTEERLRIQTNTTALIRKHTSSGFSTTPTYREKSIGIRTGVKGRAAVESCDWEVTQDLSINLSTFYLLNEGRKVVFYSDGQGGASLRGDDESIIYQFPNPGENLFYLRNIAHQSDSVYNGLGLSVVPSLTEDDVSHSFVLYCENDHQYVKAEVWLRNPNFESVTYDFMEAVTCQGFKWYPVTNRRRGKWLMDKLGEVFDRNGVNFDRGSFESVGVL